MRDNFNKQLDLLHGNMIKMGSMCEEVITLAVSSLENDDPAIPQKVVSKDSEIDRIEREIETLCLRLMLMQQPVAADLRQISAALKMITDLERIGDQAADIAEISPYLTSRGSEEAKTIKLMADAASMMVTKSIDAFVQGNTDQAKRVIEYDDVVDEYFTNVKASLIRLISEKKADGELAVDLLMIAKYFERIADHATNIAEWVEYSVTGVHRSSEITQS